MFNFKSPQPKSEVLSFAKISKVCLTSFCEMFYSDFFLYYAFRFVRAQHYRYQYTEIGSKQAQEGAWWKRRLIGSYLPEVSLESLESYIKSQSWDLPKYAKRKIREERRAKRS